MTRWQWLINNQNCLPYTQTCNDNEEQMEDNISSVELDGEFVDRSITCFQRQVDQLQARLKEAEELLRKSIGQLPYIPDLLDKINSFLGGNAP